MYSLILAKTEDLRGAILHSAQWDQPDNGLAWGPAPAGAADTLETACREHMFAGISGSCFYLHGCVVQCNKSIILVQADMAGSSPGALFEAVVKLSCEIIEFGWTKDRALVDTFIMRLAAYVRERNDYEEEVFFLFFLIHVNFML